jgi:DnaJ-class molecular chaperone
MAPPVATDPGACPPCRGTGKVISMLGGERSERPCPWCGGSGRREDMPGPKAA